MHLLVCDSRSSSFKQADEPSPINFPVQIQGQGLERVDSLGHHVAGQMHAAVLQRLALIERLLARHESNDTIGRTISHGPSNRNDLIGPASLSKYGLNFLQFCPISSNLHLIVDSPKIVHAAARILFDQIPCPVPDCVLRSAQSDKL